MILINVLLALFVVCFGLNLALYIVKWYDAVNLHRTPDNPSWRAGLKPWSMAKGIFLESAAIFFCLVTYPLHFVFDRMPRSPEPSSKPPVLLVHAWGTASHSFLLVRRLLKRLGYANIYSITYRPITGDAAALARQVADKIDLVLSQTGAARIVIITHSMGGVLTRYAIKNLGADGKVEKVIALGGPHMGSRIAVLAPIGLNTLQMTYQSAFTQELAQGGMTPGTARYVSIYSDFDNFVLPPSSSDLGPGAKNITVPYHGHLYLVYSPQVLKIIRQELP